MKVGVGGEVMEARRHRSCLHSGVVRCAIVHSDLIYES